MARVIQWMCAHCGHIRFYDASSAELDAATIEALSTGECPRCHDRGALVTLDAEPPSNQPLEPLTGAA